MTNEQAWDNCAETTAKGSSAVVVALLLVVGCHGLILPNFWSLVLSLAAIACHVQQYAIAAWSKRRFIRKTETERWESRRSLAGDYQFPWSIDGPVFLVWLAKMTFAYLGTLVCVLGLAEEAFKRMGS